MVDRCLWRHEPSRLLVVYKKHGYKVVTFHTYSLRNMNKKVVELLCNHRWFVIVQVKATGNIIYHY